MTTRSILSRALPTFSHLLGGRANVVALAAGASDDDKDGTKEAKGKAGASDDEPKPDDDKDDKGANASTDDDLNDDGTPKEKKGTKGAKGKADDDDSYAATDDKDEEMRGESAAAQARRREQARCAAIFASPAAGVNPALAAHLAFNTRQPRDEALGNLEIAVATSPAPAPAAAGRDLRRDARAAMNPAVTTEGGGQAPTEHAKTMGAWDKVHEKNARQLGWSNKR